MSGYDVTIALSSYPTGGHVLDPVGVGTWVNRMPQFVIDDGQVSSSQFQWVRVAFKSTEPPTFIPPGRYLLGGLPIEVPNPDCNVARISSGVQVGSPYRTGFASQCAGNDGGTTR
ncbi:MAG: hypothetical protein AAB011_00615 [Candidatus Eisenbacteria bacterium]